MARRVRAVVEGEQKYAGFDGRKRYVNNEEFDWVRPGKMPLVVRDEDGSIVSGWLELISGDPNEGCDEPPPKKKPQKRSGLTPAMVVTNATTDVPAAHKGRASDRVIG